MATVKQQTVLALGVKAPHFTAVLIRDFHHPDRTQRNTELEIRDLNQWICQQIDSLFSRNDSVNLRARLLYTPVFGVWLDSFSTDVLPVLAKKYGDCV